MRVVVAAVSSNRSMSGVSRHAANLVKCLLARREISAVHVLVGSWEQRYVSDAIARHDARLHVHGLGIGAGTVSRNIWYFHTLPAVATQLRADLVHLAYPSPIQRRAFPCPVVTTLHDLYPYDIPSNFGFPKVFFNRVILKQCLRNADAIACVSDSTRLRMGLRLPQLLPKAVTIYNCVESARNALKPSFAVSWADRPFVLCVAQHRKNKNIPVALAAFKLLLSKGALQSGTRFVLIGMQGPETGRIEETICQLGLEQRVILAGGISDAEMTWCYRNCQVLLAPSIVEGFGLPIIEGRLAGCRIVCSDIAAFREVGGSTCRFVELDPDAERDFAAAVEASLGQRRPLPERLSSLSPTALAPLYLRLYRKLLDSRYALASSPPPAELTRPEQAKRIETKAAV